MTKTIWDILEKNALLGVRSPCFPPFLLLAPTLHCKIEAKKLLKMMLQQGLKWHGFWFQKKSPKQETVFCEFTLTHTYTEHYRRFDQEMWGFPLSARPRLKTRVSQ